MAVTFEQATLANGLTILGECDESAHTAAAGFFVKTGARDESAALMGVSHFLEHMMFKGTKRRSADDINREFDELGASYNAYTTSEMTCFYAHVLPEQLGKSIDLLGDMMRPALREEDFAQERGVILEEIAMYKDNPFWVLYDEVSTRRYPGHALGHLVLGTTQTIQEMHASQMREYFEHWYAADNTVVALSGRVDFDTAVAQLQELCAGWSTLGAARDNAEPAAASDDFVMHRSVRRQCHRSIYSTQHNPCRQPIKRPDEHKSHRTNLALHCTQQRSYPFPQISAPQHTANRRAKTRINTSRSPRLPCQKRQTPGLSIPLKYHLPRCCLWSPLRCPPHRLHPTL